MVKVERKDNCIHIKVGYKEMYIPENLAEELQQALESILWDEMTYHEIYDQKCYLEHKIEELRADVEYLSDLARGGEF